MWFYFYYSLCPNPPWGEGEHLDLLSPKCVSASIHVRPRLYQTLFTWYFLQFFTNNFKFSDVVTMDKTLNWLSFSWPWLNFQDHGGHYVSNLTLFTQYFLQLFARGFKILRYGNHWWDLELINFSLLWLNFESHSGLLCFKINFIYAIFPIVFCQWLSKSQIWWSSTRPWIDKRFVTIAQFSRSQGVIMFQN